MRQHALLSVAALSLALAARACAGPEAGALGRTTGPAVDAAAGHPGPPSSALLTVVQCCMYLSGRYAGASTGAQTWETAGRFALAVSDKVPGAALVGMQEVDSDDAARQIRDLLAEATKGPWTYLWTPQGRRGRGDGLAILWRTDRVTMERDLGRIPLDFLDDRTVLRAMGAWFRHAASGRTFGFFTAKLVRPDQDRGAHPANEHTQRQEAWRLRQWVREAMLPYPDDARVLAIDLESSIGSAAWMELNEDFQSDGDKRFTVGSFDRLFEGSRHDFLWWRGNATAREPLGFLGRAGRSDPIGGQHRFVWGTVRL